jgi:hypothetical protein
MESLKVYNGRILFDHLPKTAGQAVNAWLRGELGSGCVTDNLGGGHQEMVRRYGREYSVVSGHVDFCGEGLDLRYRYMTIFRDPVDRGLSHLFFMLNNHEADQLPELFVWAEEFVASAGRQLNAGLLGYISNLYTNHFIAVENSNPAAISEGEKVARALEVIKKYDVVGLYEEMPEFVADAADLFGIPVPQSIERVNVTRSRPAVNQISPELRQRIIELNQLDIRLYNEVVAWKRSQPPKERKKIFISPWQKYEPVRDRVFTTPDIPAVMAVLREGADVIHGQMLTFEVDFLLTRQVAELEAGIHIFDENRQWAFGTNSTLQGKEYRDIDSGCHRITHHLIANLPAGTYTAGFAFAERLPEGGVQELAWYDVLCEFRVKNEVSLPFAGYACLPAEVTLQPSDESLVVQNPAGRIAPIGLIDPMRPNEECKITVTVSNAGNQLWQGDTFRPVQLSYHWYDQTGKPVLYEGLRTDLPAGGIVPGGTVEMEMTVQALASPGRYELVLTLMQEMVGWFEEKSFKPYKIEVEIA